MAEAVLIVDDDASTREVFSKVLAARNFTVLDAANAQSALALLGSHLVSVAVVDRYMPEIDGLWLIAQMRKQFPSVAVVLVSGDDSIPLRFALQPGVIGYLVKPVPPELLINAVSDGIAWNRVARRAGR